MDGSVVTGPGIVLGKKDLCETFLGKVSNKFQGGRIDMNWLETNFKELPLNAPNIVLLHLVDFKECERLSWGSVVLAMLYWELCWATESNKMPIGGCLLLLQSPAWWRLPFLRLRVKDSYMFPLVTRWNHGPIYVGLPEHVKDIRLLLDQRLKAEFEWMSYADLDIIECIPLEFLAIRGMWDAKVPFIVYATVEMHESD
ncbi:hypothetical protein Goari_000939 [Gossypium aridum]|uniref:Aminotransferase-like plant mobile domain-containing protein n=1 Tax=Gossypium aridum TaxID=34290 RepID=A0A7J8YJ25_GOSAI|nr:hypothetical protein [Gossypium aridum]